MNTWYADDPLLAKEALSCVPYTAGRLAYLHGSPFDYTRSWYWKRGWLDASTR